MPKDFRNLSKSSITQQGQKENWPVVSARIPTHLRNKLNKLYKKRGQLSEIILKLLQEHVGVMESCEKLNSI